MAGRKAKRKVGRPRAEIDWLAVDEMGRMHCTHHEIASVLRLDRDTIYKACLRDHGVTFSEYYDARKAEGKERLRRSQLKAALNGNPAMLIWMGKQLLGQVDKSRLETKNEHSMAAKVNIYLPDNGRQHVGCGKIEEKESTVCIDEGAVGTNSEGGQGSDGIDIQTAEDPV